MITLENDTLNISFPDTHPEASTTIGFVRTLRIPDDGDTHALPPGMGHFPLRHVDDHANAVGPDTRKRGGVMLPMHASEALWLSFGRRDYPFAVKIAAGKINAVTGESWREGLHDAPQDYLVIPAQPWLDGFATSEGIIRQFVAEKLGEGYSVEEQLTGRADFGGIQIIAYPMKTQTFIRIVFDRRRQILLTRLNGMKAGLGQMGEDLQSLMAARKQAAKALDQARRRFGNLGEKPVVNRLDELAEGLSRLFGECDALRGKINVASHTFGTGSEGGSLEALDRWDRRADEWMKTIGQLEQRIQDLVRLDDDEMGLGESGHVFAMRESRGGVSGRVAACSYMDSFGLAAGGRMRQQIYRDPYGLDAWDQSVSSRCFITLAPAQAWQSITGEAPPPPPVSAKAYTEQGLPWFDYQDSSKQALGGSKVLASVKSWFTVKNEKALSNEPVNPKVILHLGPDVRKRTGNIVRESGP